MTSLTETFNYDRIRPFEDSEVQEALVRVTSNEYFLKIIDFIYAKIPIEDLVEKIRSSKSVVEFQDRFIYSFVGSLINQTILNLSMSGLENLDPDEHYLFISNHRDIVLDSALLNYKLHDHNFDISEIAIGNNLLVYPWIEDLVRMNRSFIVERDVQGRERLFSAATLSNYINHLINEKDTSLWIAQREGRTKNGDDRTQMALLKMLTIGRKGDFVDNYKNLNIVPVSISYELEPCDVAKVRENYNRFLDPSFKKDQRDDLLSMKFGMENYKGRVHYSMSRPIKNSIEKLRGLNPKEQLAELTKIVDNRIHKNYKLWPINYIAADLRKGTREFKEHYTIDERNKYMQLFETKLDDLEGDRKKLKELLLDIYANPVYNQVAAQE